VFESFKKEVDTLKKKQAELSMAELSLDERERRLTEREMLLSQGAHYSFVCRQTLRKITEDTIGIGLAVIRNDAHHISKIELAAEYLSATAFFDLKIRHSMNHDLKFQYFLPLYLSRAHFEQARTMIEDAFCCIVMGTPQTREMKSQHEKKHAATRSFSSHFHSPSKLVVPSASRARSKSVESKQQQGARLRRRSPSDFEQNVFHHDMALMVLSILMNEVLANAISEKLHPFKALETYGVFHRLLLASIERVSALPLFLSTSFAMTREVTFFFSFFFCAVPGLGRDL